MNDEHIIIYGIEFHAFINETENKSNFLCTPRQLFALSRI